MKNTIKKIASIVMAFTILGTGTTVTKTISPKTDNTIVAEAASCKHNCRWYETKYILLTNMSKGSTSYYAQTFIEIRCSKCNVSRSERPCGSRWIFYARNYLGEEARIYENWDKFREKNKADLSGVKTTGNTNTSKAPVTSSFSVHYKEDRFGARQITEGPYYNEVFKKDKNGVYLCGSALTATFSNISEIEGKKDEYSARITVTEHVR